MKASDAEITGSIIADSIMYHKIVPATSFTTSNRIVPFEGNTAATAKLSGDILFIRGDYSSNCTVVLPPASLFPGASMRIINGTRRRGEYGTEVSDGSIINLEIAHTPELESAVEDVNLVEVNSFGIAADVYNYNQGTGDAALLPYDYRSTVQFINYKNIELISNQNWYEGNTNTPHYVWMVVDAK
jgi:hypothetical protein